MVATKILTSLAPGAVPLGTSTPSGRPAQAVSTRAPASTGRKARIGCRRGERSVDWRPERPVSRFKTVMTAVMALLSRAPAVAFEDPPEAQRGQAVFIDRGLPLCLQISCCRGGS